MQGGAVANEVLTGAVLLTQWAAGIVLIVVLTFFFVKDGAQILDWILELFDEDRQPVLREAARRSWTALSAYVQGVFLVATIDAVLIGAALLIVGVPVAMPLIVLTFVAAFFPIVGAFTAGAAAVLVALVANGLPAALVIFAVIVAVQQLEGNVFYPIVVGPQAALHPVGILLALTAGGVLAGVAGAFLAMPVAAVGAAVLGYMRERREHREAAAVLLPSAVAQRGDDVAAGLERQHLRGHPAGRRARQVDPHRARRVTADVQRAGAEPAVLVAQHEPADAALRARAAHAHSGAVPADLRLLRASRTSAAGRRSPRRGTPAGTPGRPDPVRPSAFTVHWSATGS